MTVIQDKQNELTKKIKRLSDLKDLFVSYYDCDRMIFSTGKWPHELHVLDLCDAKIQFAQRERDCGELGRINQALKRSQVNANELIMELSEVITLLSDAIRDAVGTVLQKKIELGLTEKNITSINSLQKTLEKIEQDHMSVLNGVLSDQIERRRIESTLDGRFPNRIKLGNIENDPNGMFPNQKKMMEIESNIKQFIVQYKKFARIAAPLAPKAKTDEFGKEVITLSEERVVAALMEFLPQGKHEFMLKRQAKKEAERIENERRAKLTAEGGSRITETIVVKPEVINQTPAGIAAVEEAVAAPAPVEGRTIETSTFYNENMAIVRVGNRVTAYILDKKLLTPEYAGRLEKFVESCSSDYVEQFSAPDNSVFALRTTGDDRLLGKSRSCTLDRFAALINNMLPMGDIRKRGLQFADNPCYEVSVVLFNTKSQHSRLDMDKVNVKRQNDSQLESFIDDLIGESIG